MFQTVQCAQESLTESWLSTPASAGLILGVGMWEICGCQVGQVEFLGVFFWYLIHIRVSATYTDDTFPQKVENTDSAYL